MAAAVSAGPGEGYLIDRGAGRESLSLQSEVAMTDQKARDISDEKDWPNWVKVTLKWLGIAGALIGAVALVVVGVGNVWKGTSKLCAAVGICRPSAPTSAPPILPNLDVGPVDGGHTTD